jgi:hypothetical protein
MMMATKLILAMVMMEISPVVLWMMASMGAWCCGVMEDAW